MINVVIIVLCSFPLIGFVVGVLWLIVSTDRKERRELRRERIRSLERDLGFVWDDEN